MVAISLYKGNLRKATDAPRQWLMPTPQITVKDFRSLLRRREIALSRLPNPNPNPNTSGIENAIDNRTPNSVKKEDEEAGNAADCSVKVELDAENKAEPDTVVEVKEEEKAMEIAEEPNPIQTIEKAVVEYSDPVRKKEVEEKLNALKEQKHSLVQVLKMIQNAEEELKKRNSSQGVTRANVTLQLQVDIPNDSGSITRLNTPTPTPRVRSDGNHGTTGVEVEGGVPDGLVNHNSETRQLVRTSSTSLSPSSDSQHKKPAHNSVPLPVRTPGGVSASPSRFAPNAPQGHTSSLPTISASGTNYVPSSPSPAASGGTSVFRENRMTSPWN